MTSIWKRILLAWSVLFIYFREMCYLEGSCIYPISRACALLSLVNWVACVHTRVSSLPFHGEVPCELCFPANRLCFHGCPSSVWSSLLLCCLHFCILFYAQVSVCPLCPGIHGNETMMGIQLLCIFHSHCAPNQFLLLRILGVVCIPMSLLRLGNHIIADMSLILPVLEYCMGKQSTRQSST